MAAPNPIPAAAAAGVVAPAIMNPVVFNPSNRTSKQLLSSLLQTKVRDRSGKVTTAFRRSVDPVHVPTIDADSSLVGSFGHPKLGIRYSNRQIQNAGPHNAATMIAANALVDVLDGPLDNQGRIKQSFTAVLRPFFVPAINMFNARVSAERYLAQENASIPDRAFRNVFKSLRAKIRQNTTSADQASMSFRQDYLDEMQCLTLAAEAHSALIENQNAVFNG